MTRTIIPILLFVATFCFALGLVLPIAIFERLFFLTERPSLLEIVASLWTESDYFLAAVIALFSVAFPAAKLLVLHMAAADGARRHLVHRAGALSKWSMMDVLVVALAVFAAKTTGLASAAAQPGIWFYGAAALISAIIAIVLKKEDRRAETAGPVAGAEGQSR
jgi:paraquat-inducible protein A